MGFIHHTTAAAWATGLMAGSRVSIGSGMLIHPGPLATDLLCLLSSAALVVGPRHAVVTPTYVAELLNQGAGYYTLGLRAYYFVIPIIVGLFSPWAGVAATLMILPVFYYADRAPSAREPQPDQEIANPASPARFRVVKRLGH